MSIRLSRGQKWSGSHKTHLHSTKKNKLLQLNGSLQFSIGYSKIETHLKYFYRQKLKQFAFWNVFIIPLFVFAPMECHKIGIALIPFKFYTRTFDWLIFDSWLFRSKKYKLHKHWFKHNITIERTANECFPQENTVMFKLTCACMLEAWSLFAELWARKKESKNNGMRVEVFSAFNSSSWWWWYSDNDEDCYGLISRCMHRTTTALDKRLSNEPDMWEKNGSFFQKWEKNESIQFAALGLFIFLLYETDTLTHHRCLDAVINTQCLRRVGGLVCDFAVGRDVWCYPNGTNRGIKKPKRRRIGKIRCRIVKSDILSFNRKLLFDVFFHV